MASRLSVCLAFDFDTMAVWPLFGMTSGQALSRGEFGATVGIGRILDLLKRHDIKATFYVPGFTALAYAVAARRIRDEGHEIGFHGYMHESLEGLDEAGVRRTIDLGLETHHKVLGVRPVGYRTVGGEFGPHLIPLLVEYGFEYESTMGTKDFYPFPIRHGDRWTPDAPFQWGQPTPLVGVPFSYGLDDMPNFEFVPGWATNMKSPREFGQHWQAEFAYAYDNCPGGIFTTDLHPQCIGRGSRIQMLEGLIESMKQRDGVVFERTGDYVRRWVAEGAAS
ncbi:MAG: peptidoglycan-N-acetylglucosamine deacetylase [Chloroflexota bacterium]|jgi:peptidoglycan/xylan/chitin deacetylase (PgdA/CDA1 family)|nr:peptidoglycan-N-acetylglucosamine deacetylase [Chloroflexota bacterium]